jgi:putative transposase
VKYLKTILRAYRYRIYPNKEQSILVNKTIGCSRFVYNHYLAKRIELYESEKQTMNYYACASDLTTLKKEYEWLKEVDSISLQQVLKDLDNAYQNFFRRVKNGEKEVGFPRFKSRKNPKQSYRTQTINGNIQIIDNKIKLPKLGLVKFANSRNFNGKIKSCTIRRSPSGKYFVSVLVEEQINILPQNDNTIGFDLGISDFLVTSDGEIVNNPKALYQYEQKLTKLQRQLAKKQKGSNRYKKQSVKIATLHEKIKNIRTDFLQKLSTQIIKENQLIISEDLNVKGMVQNHNFAKAISDVSWSEFCRMIEYKADWYGRIYYKIDRYYPSSQTCNICGYKNTDVKDLSIRQWICPECKSEHHRDINAAVNILNQGIKELNTVT